MHIGGITVQEDVHYRTWYFPYKKHGMYKTPAGTIYWMAMCYIILHEDTTEFYKWLKKQK